MARRVKRSTRNIKWIEEHCVIPEGMHEGRKIKLRLWQRQILAQVYDTPTRRLIMSVGRKNAKTALSSFLMLLHLVGPEAKQNSQLVSAAQSREQAAILFRLAMKIVRQSPTLAPYVKINESTKQMFCPAIGTEYRALSAEASTAYGLSPAMVIHDELGQVRGPTSDLYDALETAVGAQASPLSIVISTQAANDDDLLSILIDDAATGADPRTKLILYTAPADADPFSEETIKAANPAFGDFQNAEETIDMAENAKRQPAREAKYRNLVLNQRIEVFDPYVSPSVWKACAGPVAEDFGSVPVYAGLDLSASEDLTAFVRVAWAAPEELHARCTFWLPSEGLIGKSKTEKQPYDLWHRQKYLDVTPGSAIEYSDVAGQILRIIRAENVKTIAFDRWRIDYLRPWLQQAGATEEELERFVDTGQGFKTMDAALRALDEVLLNGKLRHGGNPVLEMCAKNAVVKEDTTGNRKLIKLQKKRRIDGMIALAMAVHAETIDNDTSLITEFGADYAI